MTLTATRLAPRQLDSRNSDGLTVQLLWYPVTQEIAVEAYDGKTGQCVKFVLRNNACAYDAFYHPFAYADNPHLVRSVTM